MRLMFAVLLFPLLIHAESLLQNEVQEKKAQELFAKIRCPVCEGQSIRDSNAEIAILLREFIRQEIFNGKPESEIIATLKDNYGGNISFEPAYTLESIVLMAVSLSILLGAFVFVLGLSRRLD